MTIELTELQLDALRELANIASGTAANALSQMLAREVDLKVPRALALPLADAVEACGDPEEEVAGVVIPVCGDLDAQVLLLIPPRDIDRLCELLGVEPATEVGDSAICEIGNIVGTAYLNGLAAMTALELLPSLPELHVDMLGAIVATLLAHTVGPNEVALVLESELEVAREPCSMSFLLLPTSGGIAGLLAPLGLAGPAT